jgi:hypothetical protein
MSSFETTTQLSVIPLFTYGSTDMGTKWVDGGPGGQQIFTWSKGGTFQGERLRGEMVPGPCSERSVIRSDGVVVADVNLLLRTHDGAEILMKYIATAVPQATGMRVRNFPIFETSHPDYLWINSVQAITYYDVVGSTITPREVYQLV